MIPIRSESEAREKGSKGGKASGVSRRRKKTMKQVMDMLLAMPADNSTDYNFLIESGINVEELDPELITNMLVVNAALMARAKTGDPKAIHELRGIIRDDAYINHKIKYENEKLKIEKAKSSENEYNQSDDGFIDALSGKTEDIWQEE